MPRGLTLVDETVPQAAGQLFGGLVNIILVIALALTGQKHMQHVVRIVVPLRIEGVCQIGSVVSIVFKNKVYVTLGPDRAANFGSHFVEPISFGNGMNSVKSE